MTDRTTYRLIVGLSLMPEDPTLCCGYYITLKRPNSDDLELQEDHAFAPIITWAALAEASARCDDISGALPMALPFE